MTQGTINTGTELAIGAAPAEGHNRMLWGPILGGMFAALGIWILLYSFGIAVGLSAVDPNDSSTLRRTGILTGVWGVITPPIALFVGAFVASRAAGVLTKGLGVIHGLVVWGLTTVFGAWVLVNMLGALLGGVFSVGRTAVEAGTAVVGGALGQAGRVGDLAQSIGFDANDALGPINRKLTESGMPTVSPNQLEAAVKDVLDDALRQGRLDRELLVGSIAQNTALSRADAEMLADRIRTQFETARAKAGEKLSTVARTAETEALKAADTTGKAFWGVFNVLLLGMLAALGGGAFGATRRVQDWADRARMRAIRRPIVTQPAG
jgi:hypothetical protein